MNIHVYMYIHISIHRCIYVHIHIHMYIYYTSKYIHTCIHMCICIFFFFPFLSFFSFFSFFFQAHLACDGVRYAGRTPCPRGPKETRTKPAMRAKTAPVWGSEL